MTKPIPPLSPAERERFWSNVDVGPEESCWLWKQKPLTTGYGLFQPYRQGKSLALLAHRVAYALARGPIPDETPVILHSCDVRLCCNPRHLSCGTQEDNVRDAAKKGRMSRTHRAKLTPEQVLQVFSAEGSQREIAERFGISQGQVSNIKNRKSWGPMTSTKNTSSRTL